MKQIRFIATVCIAFLAFSGCTEDEQISYVLQNISAPTNVQAVFDISQDDTGTVSVTPTAVGASAFDIYFGDSDNETPTQVGPGETVTHVYGEGTYNLRIVAVGPTGLTSELVRVVNISFTPPSNLAVDISLSASNPFEVIVAPTADNVTVFDIYYGDVTDEVPQTIMAGETGSHIYAETGDYTVRVVARGAGAATVEYSEVVTISGASDPISLPITFDAPTVNYAFGTFNGASYEVVDNPDASGANPVASKVGAITNAGVNWEGGAFTLGTPVDFSGSDKTITMKFWSNVAVPLLLKFEGGVNGERENEVVANHGGTGWEEISFDFATSAVKSYIDGTQGVGEAFVPTGQYATLVLFVDGPGTTAGTFYMDDIEQSGGTVTPLELPISFDAAGVDYAFGTFNGASFNIVDNPDPSGANASVSKVGAITNSGNNWEGGAFNLDTPVDFSGSNKTIRLKLWSTVSVPVLLKFEGGVNGERQNEVVATHGGTGWEELSFDFATSATKSYIDGTQGVGEPFVPTGQYATLVLFIDGPGNTAGTFYMDDIAQDGATQPLALPMSFDNPAVAYDMGTFNGASYAVVTNPDLSGVNTSASNVGALTNSGVNWEGGAFSMGTPVDFSGNDKIIRMKFWSNAAVPVLLKFEGGVSGERQNEVVANHGGTGWEELTFDFATDATKSYIDGTQGVGEPFVPTGQYATLVIFVDGPGTTAGTFYMDDIEQVAPSTDLKLPISFDQAGVAYDMTTFNGASYAVVTNPDLSGANTVASNVGAVTNSGVNWEGGYFVLDVPVDFAGSNKTIAMKFWSNAAVPVLLKFEGGVSGERQCEVVANHGGTGWEVLTFDFSTDAVKSYIDGTQGVGEAFVPTGQYAQITFFVDGPGTAAGTFYMDDIVQQ
ncbi:hypothetical protein OZ410_07960 [Robiginitalea sp. M366]|uniref:hypothetical protein n=1 Tax=Robiginitalea aestuariiviva TaxID=3036903 RepID=UPI00240D609D|nr:hypothetical protein [Robiginitalea aestuariiviva]MDG1572246.1 hypothetical protein [Robiginitalea aestuariiviva]